MEDKKRILKMVEEGKISAEEAIKLLEVLDSNEKVDTFVKDEDDDFFDIKNENKNGKMEAKLRLMCHWNL